MQKKAYTALEIEVNIFETEDVIVASGEFECEGFTSGNNQTPIM